MSDIIKNIPKILWLGSEKQEDHSTTKEKPQRSYIARMAALKFQTTRKPNGQPLRRF